MIISHEHHKNLELLIDGQEAFERIIQQIKQAQKSIYINMFIWRDDKIGNCVGKELLAAANRGVKIKISKDKLGAIFEKAEENRQSFFHKGFDIKLWLKQKFIENFCCIVGETVNYKQKSNDLVNSILTHKNIHVDKERIKEDHSKFFIFDDQIIITGGMNIENRAVYHDVSGTKWKDYMIEIAGKEFVHKLKNKLNGVKENDENPWFKFVLNTKSDKVKNFEIKPKILELLSSTEKTIYIQMPYFGDLDITNKIIEIANFGIEVTILLPKKANLQSALNHKIMKYILLKTDRRVNIYFCKEMLHAKMLVIDEKIILLGSANLNRKSMKRLSELNVLVNVKDSSLINIVIKSIKDRINNSEKISDVTEIKFNKLRAFFENLYS